MLDELFRVAARAWMIPSRSRSSCIDSGRPLYGNGWRNIHTMPSDATARSMRKQLTVMRFAASWRAASRIETNGARTLSAITRS